jgi:glucose/mannose-6-phosphate isomerase
MIDRSSDKSDLYSVLKNFPQQLTEALKIARDARVSGSFDNIVICGVGGSALAGDLFETYFEKLRIPVHINRNYQLPKEAGSNSLVVVITFSGNTEEPISAFREALDKGMSMVGIASGGQLERLCKKNGIPIVILPKGPKNFQPRHALGYAFASLVKVLSNSRIIPSKDEEITNTADILSGLDLQKDSQAFAKRLYKKIPVVYSSERWEKVARIWKIKFNESSKVMAFFNWFPELNHNEMIGHTEASVQGNFHTIIIRDKEDLPRIKKRMELTADLLQSRGEEVTLVDTMDTDMLTKIFATILYGDWIAYWLAMLYKIDPTPVDLVEEFKKKLGPM